MKLDKLRAREITFIAAMVAFSLILTLWEIPYSPYLKIDFALVPIIIVIIVINYYAGIAALLIQFLLIFFRNPGGWLINAIASLFFIIAFIITAFCLRKLEQKKPLISLAFPLVVATITTTLLTTLANYAVLIPWLFPKFAAPIGVIFSIYAPFNLLKFSLVSIMTFFLIPQIKKYIIKK